MLRLIDIFTRAEERESNEALEAIKKEGRRKEKEASFRNRFSIRVAPSGITL